MSKERKKLKPISDKTARIVGKLAKERFVEKLIQNVLHRAKLDDELEDLSQIIYVALLEINTARLEALIEEDRLRYFVVGIINNQYYSSTSTYYYDVRKFKMISSEISSQISETTEDKDCKLSSLAK